MHPVGRQTGLTLQEMGDELVIIDQERRDVHRLNLTAALIWRHCDGQTSVGELAALVRRDLSIAANDDLVWLTLHDLSDAGLLQEPLPAGTRPGISRRKLLAAVGLVGGAGVIAPMVKSALAPASAMAAAQPQQATAPASTIVTTGKPVFWLTAGTFKAAFTDMDGLGTNSDVNEVFGSDLKGGSGVTYTSGHSHNSPITLKRGLSNDTSLWKWRTMVIDGGYKFAAKTGALTLTAADGKTTLAQWSITNMWPTEISYPAPDTSVASTGPVEEFKLIYDTINRIK